MAYLCSDGSATWSALYGFRVQFKGKFGRWNDGPLYCSQEASNFCPLHGTKKETRVCLEYVGDGPKQGRVLL